MISKIFRHEFRSFVVSKRFLLNAFGLPLLIAVQLLVVRYVSRSAGEPFNIDDFVRRRKPIAVVDSARLLSSANSPLHKAKFTADITYPLAKSALEVAFDRVTISAGVTYKTVLRFLASNADAQAALVRDEVDAVVIMPETLAVPYRVELILPKRDYNVTQYIRSVCNDLLHELAINGARLDYSQIKSLMSNVEFDEHVLGEEPQSKTFSLAKNIEATLKKGIPYAIPALIFFVMGITLEGVVISIMNERRSKLIEILLTSVGALNLFIGKVCAVSLGCFMIFLIWLSFLALAVSAASHYFPLFSISSLVDRQMLFAILFGFVGIFFYGFFSAGYSGYVGNPENPNKLSLRLIGILFVLPVFAISKLVDDPHSFIITIFFYLPFYSPFVAPLALCGKLPFSTAEVALSFALLIICTALTAIIAARFFEKGYYAQLDGDSPLRKSTRFLRGLIQGRIPGTKPKGCAKT